MFVTNSVSRDPRVRREADTLAKAGYEVVVLGVREAGTSSEEDLDGIRIIRFDTPILRSWAEVRANLRLALLSTLKRRFPRSYDRGKAVYRRLRPQLADGAALPVVPPLQQATATGPSRLWDRLYVDQFHLRTIFWLNLAMAEEAVRQAADVYHAHDLDTLLAAYLAKRRSGKKLIYDFHEIYTKQFPRGVKTPLWWLCYTVAERLLYRWVDHAITVCDSISDWMAQRYGGRRAITLKNVPSGKPARTPPRSLGTGYDNVILYHGGYSSDRGLEQLIESAQYLKRGRIVLRGAGELEARLRELVTEKGLERVVSFAPPVPLRDIVQSASVAQIGVLPYTAVCLNNRLCLPNKLFEYMMAGLAIAGSDLPELRAIILGFDVGLVFDPEDPWDLARALNELLADEVKLEKRRQNALEAARTVFNWDQESQKLLKLYAEAFATSPVRSWPDSRRGTCQR